MNAYAQRYNIKISLYATKVMFVVIYALCSEQPVLRIYSSYKPIFSTNISVGESDAVIFRKILIFIIKVEESSAKKC